MDKHQQEYEARVAAELAALPIEERATRLARQWQTTPQFALRFLQLEAEVAALKSK